MSIQETPQANRLHIGFFGRRNAGKSSVVNAVTGQELSIVSQRKGTTTDPVRKAMELLPLGAVVIIDTPGLDDDEAGIGALRVERTKRMLHTVDIAVLVVDGTEGLQPIDRELLALLRAKELPHLLVYNKLDLCTPHGDGLWVSAKTGAGMTELKEALGKLRPVQEERPLVRDLLHAGDVVLLVTPLDESAPKGRMILPQVQVLRDCLDAHAIAVMVQETELAEALERYAPAMVITDSQVFQMVAQIVPPEIPLTSFSILMARYKGFLETAVDGISALQNLQEGDTVLIAEGCTHHRQCNDIGTVKIPRWLRAFTGNTVQIATCSGRDFPEDLSPYRVVLHCGGCMLTEREVSYRQKCAQDQNIPFTNYGLTIAHIQGILPRSLALFPDLQKKLQDE